MGRLWCYNEPTVSVDGRHVRLSLGLPADRRFAITAETDFTIDGPSDAAMSVIRTDTGFNNAGQVVALTKNGSSANQVGPVPLTVQVTISGESGGEVTRMDASTNNGAEKVSYFNTMTALGTGIKVYG